MERSRWFRMSQRPAAASIQRQRPVAGRRMEEQGASLAVVTFSALGDGHADFYLSDVQAVWIGPPFAFYLPLVLK